jgi:peroxiredoxin
MPTPRIDDDGDMRRMPAKLVWIATAFTVVMAVTLSFAHGRDEPGLAAGTKAPGFTLTDLDGVERKLSDYKGKVLVIEWTDGDCPYNKRCYRKGLVRETLDAMKKLGDDYVYIAINSTADKSRSKVIAASRKLLEKHDMSHPVLIDYDGKVGRKYDARTTPHMFIIDRKGVVRYQGAFTDDAHFKKEDRTNFVVKALEQIHADRDVTPAFNQPWGGRVKYKR